MKKHNFYAGPSIMPEYTNEKVIEAIKDFAGTGLLDHGDFTPQQGICSGYGTGCHHG